MRQIGKLLTRQCGVCELIYFGICAEEIMKKALIIGGAGFVGKYLADYLVGECGYQVCSTKMKQEVLEDVSYEVVDMDLLVKGK